MRGRWRAGVAIGISAGVMAASWKGQRWWRKTSAEFDEILERRLRACDG